MLGLLIAAGGSAGAVKAVDLTGTWTCCGGGGAGAQDFVITTGTGSISGIGNAPGGGEFATITGSLSGNSVTIVTTYTTDIGYVATFTGTVSADGTTMSGTWVSNQQQSGTWTATRVGGAPPTTSTTAPTTTQPPTTTTPSTSTGTNPVPPQGSAGANLIVNGGFESPRIGSPFATYGSQFSSIPGWTVSGSVDLIMASYWQAAGGNQSLDLEGFGTGSVSQTVQTTAGVPYRLSWAMGGNPLCQTPLRILHVSWDGRLVEAPTFDTSGHTNQDLGWAVKTLTITAAGSQTTVAFTEATPNHSNCGVTLDDVSLTRASAAPTTTSGKTTTTTAAAPTTTAPSTTTPTTTGPSTTTPTTTTATTTPVPHRPPSKAGRAVAAAAAVDDREASLVTCPRRRSASSRRTLINLAITVAALLFITFPAQLFNHTFEENYEDIAAFWERRLKALKRLREASAGKASGLLNRLAVIVVIILGAFLGGLLDPHFGFNHHSATTYASTILFTIWGITISTLVVYYYRRSRGRDLSWSLKALPAGLLIGGLCVIVSRASAFEPGYLYGVVCWAAFATDLEQKEQGHTVALSALTTVAIAFGAWFLWEPVNHHAAASGANWALVLADDFLGAAFTGGLIGALIGLLPLNFLPGGTLASWHRGAWAAVFALVTFSFVEIMLDPGTNAGHRGHGALATVLVLFVFFGGGSVAFAGYFARKRRKKAAAEAAAATESGGGEQQEPGVAGEGAAPAPSPQPPGGSEPPPEGGEEAGGEPPDDDAPSPSTEPRES